MKALFHLNRLTELWFSETLPILIKVSYSIKFFNYLLDNSIKLVHNLNMSGEYWAISSSQTKMT
jgi:hypothetical protein